MIHNQLPSLTADRSLCTVDAMHADRGPAAVSNTADGVGELLLAGSGVELGDPALVVPQQGHFGGDR